MAAQSTCYLAVRPDNTPDCPSPTYQYGTAFFIGPTTLITAAHLVPDNKRKIVAQLPGTLRATAFVEKLFTKDHRRRFETFECKCLGTGLPDADIAILQVSGNYEAKVYLEIEYSGLKPNDPVDVVGYPGMYDERYVLSMYPDLLDEDSMDDVFALFPKRRLVVTHGPVVLGGIMPTYQLSTIAGMSGSPVILNGKAKGKHIVNCFSIISS